MPGKNGKTIKQNDNFLSVSEYRLLDLKAVQESCKTGHLSDERMYRLDTAFELNKEEDGTQAPIDSVFLVDKGHKDGDELHCVTERGIIYILNRRKFNLCNSALITVLIARPNQAERLYAACDLEMPPGLIQCCMENQRKNLNMI